MMLRKTADAIRFLSMDAVHRANSGHPGAPMALADLMTVLYHHHLRYNPKNPTWSNRDRFVLSNGHASMLLYSTLHLAGYPLSIEDIKNFRQLHSLTPGHPEHDIKLGIETTTGPLGQGLANAVGMAIAEKTLAHQFPEAENLIDHHTYVVLGDGCLMEGISHEAASLAGVLNLHKLIVIWDDNGISIDGKLHAWQNEDVCKRFEAYGFEAIREVDGHDLDAIDSAINEAKSSSKPSFIQLKTQIAYGSELANNPKAHGAPLNKDQIANSRKMLNWDYDAFFIPAEIYEFFNHDQYGDKLEQDWNEKFSEFQMHHPVKAQELQRRWNQSLPQNFDSNFKKIISDELVHQQEHQKNNGSVAAIATRSASQKSLDSFAAIMPELFGGSADLTLSNLTFHSKSQSINTHPAGNYCNYGVREFAMCAVMNGISLHGGFIPYGGTFLVFSDYARPAIRLASLMKTKVIYVFTHDSIGVGEDGPTHQPIEHLASLRLIPNLRVWRPCDSIETQVAYKQALTYQGPSLLALSRQAISGYIHSLEQIEDIEKGGYTIYQPDSINTHNLDGIFIATGSEVGMAIEVAKKYNAEGVSIRVVSLPCVELFLAQSKAYQQKVLPEAIQKRVVIEAGVSRGWEGIAGINGKIIAINSFGQSGPAGDVFDYFGLNEKAIYESFKQMK